MYIKNWLPTILLIFSIGCSTSPAQDPVFTATPSRIATNSPTPVPVLPTETLAPPTATSPPPTPTTIPPTATIALPKDPSPGETWPRQVDSMTMVFIPAGEFVMGSTEDNPCTHLDELPQHTVYLDAYWIDQTEVTNAQYGACVEAETCQPPTSCDWGAPTYGDQEKANHPVVCVNWDEAGAYCEWIGGRLPTEAEWEKAARGTDALEYPWGEEFDSQRCNSGESGLETTTPVGAYSPTGDSPYGLADMAGNVLEWVIDRYDIEYYGRSSSRNPRGPAKGDRRSLRGGNWYGDICNARTTYRYYDLPYGRGPGVGFRCVVPARD